MVGTSRTGPPIKRNFKQFTTLITAVALANLCQVAKTLPLFTAAGPGTSQLSSNKTTYCNIRQPCEILCILNLIISPNAQSLKSIANYISLSRIPPSPLNSPISSPLLQPYQHPHAPSPQLLTLPKPPPATSNIHLQPTSPFPPPLHL